MGTMIGADAKALNELAAANLTELNVEFDATGLTTKQVRRGTLVIEF